MAIKTIRVFAEYTSDGYVPMPSQGNIDYGITIGNSFPETQPSSYQTDDPNIDVAVNTMTDFYVWIRTHGSPWNPSYTRVVRVYPDSPSINSVVMNMIVAVGSGGTSINAGGGVTYYLNGGTSQGVLDGSTYYEMSKTPVEGAGVDFFKINTTGFQNIAQFVTDAGDPSLLKIPPGAWPLGFYFSASDNSGNPRFYAEIYKYSQAGVFTLLGSSVASPEVISNGVAIDYYTTTVTIPDTTLLITDRIAIRIFVDTDGNRTVNFHTQDSHLASVGTTFANGLTAINGLTKQVQFIAIGNAGSDAAIVSSDDTHTINLPTASATKRGLLNNTDWSTFNSKQAALSGTGFVKIDGSTISYDNSSYQPLDGDLTAIGALAGNTGILKKTGANTWELDTTTYLSTGVAADTYQRKDKMVSNLLASDTEYPNSNAVLAKLALKADIANPQFTGSMNIKGAESRINFYDEADAIKYFIGYDSGFLRIYQSAGSASRFYINSDGKTFIPGILEAGTIIKTGGTASQFLKADGTVDSNTYITSSSLSNYLLSATAASTYQRLDKMVSNLLASDTEYPNSNAVLAALALKANAANPTFTGDFTISGATPRLYFVDTDNNPDYTLFTDSGYFYIYDQTAGATRFSINSSGNINSGVGKSITAGSFVKESGTASQYLMADGSVSLAQDLSGYLLKSGGSITGNISYTGDNYTTYGPNSTWGASLRVGGNGRTVTGVSSASVVATNGNLHIDGGTDKGTYINFYAGTLGVVFGTGASGVAASVDTSGNIWKGATIGAGTQYVYNSGTWGINITGTAASAPNGSNINNYYNSTAGEGYGFRFWNGDESYKLSMGVGAQYQYGPVTDYSIKLHMGNGAGRGIVMGVTSSTPTFAHNTTSGNTQVAGSLTATSLTINTGGIGTWSPFVVTSTSLWGDGANQYVTIGAGGSAGIMINNPHIVWNAAENSAAAKYGRSGGVSTGSYYVAGTGASNNFFIAKDGISPIFNINSSNNASFIGTVTAPTFSGNLSGNATTATTATNALEMANLGNAITGIGYISNWDPRPGVGYAAYAINNHTGVTISGYGGYGGVRLYSSGYPTHAGSILRLEASDSVKTFGILYNDTSVRSPIFYDSADTNYYIDANSNSNLATLSLNGNDNQLLINAPTNGAAGIFYRENNANKWETYHYQGKFRFYSYVTNQEELSLDNSGGFLTSRTSMRAPIFYDSQDAGYYVDPNSESNLYRFTSAAMTRNAINYLSINSPFATRSTQSINYQNGTMGWGQTDFNTVFSNWGSGFIDTWSSPANAPGGSTHYVGLQGIHYNHVNGANQYGFQMACAGESDNRFFWRSAWAINRSWVEMVHTGNIASQVAAQTAGNTNSISSAVNSAYTWYGIQYFLTNNGTSAVNNSNSAALQAYSTGNNSAFMSFHRGGYYAVNMGLDSDNVFRIGGWSAGANRLQLDMSGNLTLAASVNAPSGYVSSPNPWGTANSAFFPNGITTAGSTNWIYGYTYIGNAPSNGSGHEFFTNGNARSTGTYTASAFYESSDSRLKDLLLDDVQIKDIENLKAKFYIKNGKHEYGYFAQEAETYMPSAVTKNSDGYLNLSYREVHTVKIARLEKRVADLEKQLNIA